MANKNYSPDKDFQKLAEQINNAIIENDGLIGDQSEQVKLVMDLEKKFKHQVQSYQQCADIYRKFITYVTNDLGNILSAQTYFREPSKTFSSKITSHIKNENVKELMKYHINYQLINFIVTNWKGPLPPKVKEYYENFTEARRILIENNLPLAINRAKLFYRKTPRSHLTLLDLIDICTQGLVSGVDKYVGSYNKVWRSVCIGFMVGYMIDEYSKTFLRMFPSDKKILYRANSLRYRLKIEDIDELTKAVNESFQDDKDKGRRVPQLPISEIYVRTLLNGSSYISADTKTSTQNNQEEDEGFNIYDYHADPEENIEEQVEKKDLLSKILHASKDLEVIEKKIIRLKGVSI